MAPESELVAYPFKTSEPTNGIGNRHLSQGHLSTGVAPDARASADANNPLST